jgi:flagellar hook-associated protein 3 FlgL
MQLRVTPQTIVANAVSAAQQQYAQLATLQQEASSGKRISQPSDDPVGEVQVLSYQAQDNRLAVYQQNISDAQAKLNDSVSTLTQVSQLLTQAKQAGLQGTQSTNPPAALQALGNQVDSILKEVMGLANTQQNGQYLYGGTASQAAPFTPNSQGQVVYNGSAQAAGDPIGDGQQVDTLYAGSQVFQSTGGPDVFQVLASLRDALLNTSNLTPANQEAAVSQSLQHLDNANSNLLTTVGRQSASLQNLQGLDQQMQNVHLQLQEQITNVQGADLSQVVLGLQEQQNLLEATLYSVSHVLSASLLTFLH